jgi:hypothetical protein
LTLATKFGQYQVTPSGSVSYYTKTPGAEDFALTMYSRSGQLPEVMGVVVNKTFTHRHVTGENIKKIVQENDGFLPLNQFFHLWKSEMLGQSPMIGISPISRSKGFSELWRRSTNGWSVCRDWQKISRGQQGAWKKASPSPFKT